MSNFLEQYGKALFTLVLVAILIAFAGPLGMKIKNATTEKVSTTEEIGDDEVYTATTGRPKPPKEFTTKLYVVTYSDNSAEISRNPIKPDINKTVKDNNKTVSKPSDIEFGSGFVVNKYHITKLIIKSSIKIKDAEFYFGNMQALQNIENLNYLYTNECTNMYNMFYQCLALTSLDLSRFDTSKVTNMKGMFQSCRALTNLDLREFDTSNVTGMSTMFYYCQNLTSLDLSVFNTEKVTDMGHMFYCCNKLKSITAPQTVKEKILNSESSAWVPSGVTWITN